MTCDRIRGGEDPRAPDARAFWFFLVVALCLIGIGVYSNDLPEICKNGSLL